MKDFQLKIGCCAMKYKSNRASLSLEQILLLGGAAMLAFTSLVFFFEGYATYLDRFTENNNIIGE